MTTILSKSNPSSGTSDDFTVQANSSSNAEAALPEGVAKELVRWFKLLADETRLKILFLLLERRELNVRSLCDKLELSQPAVSHHLALLRVDGLIECRRDGKHNYYSLLPERFGDLIGKVLSAVPGEEPNMHFGEISLSVVPHEKASE